MQQCPETLKLKQLNGIQPLFILFEQNVCSENPMLTKHRHAKYDSFMGLILSAVEGHQLL